MIKLDRKIQTILNHSTDKMELSKDIFMEHLKEIPKDFPREDMYNFLEEAYPFILNDKIVQNHDFLDLYLNTMMPDENW